MKIKKEIIENFMKSKQLLENKRNGDLVIGTSEYTAFLEKIINDLKTVKGSLKTRSKNGKANRKEADMNEGKDGGLSRGDIKNFIKSLETE